MVVLGGTSHQHPLSHVMSFLWSLICLHVLNAYIYILIINIHVCILIIYTNIYNALLLALLLPLLLNKQHSTQPSRDSSQKNIPAKLSDQSHDYSDRILSLISVNTDTSSKANFTGQKMRWLWQNKLMIFSLWWTRWPREVFISSFCLEKACENDDPLPKKRKITWKSWKAHPLEIMCTCFIYIYI